MEYCIGGFPRSLGKRQGTCAIIALTSPSTIRTSTFSATHYSTSPVTHNTTFHTHSYAIGFTTPIQPLPPTAPLNWVKPPLEPPLQPSWSPPSSRRSTRHLPQTTTILKNNNLKKSVRSIIGKGNIQLLRYHKITKIWIPFPSLFHDHLLSSVPINVTKKVPLFECCLGYKL